jgi:hypothetical protein
MKDQPVSGRNGDARGRLTGAAPDVFIAAIKEEHPWKSG